MRSKFDGYVTRLQMACRVVTEDFVYPTDKHGNRYGWGWALLTTPERLFGRPNRSTEPGASSEGLRGVSPQESLDRILAHLRVILPQATEKQLLKLIA
jgi:hypothetical protein